MSRATDDLRAYLEDRAQLPDDYVVDDWVVGDVMEEFEPRTLQLGTLRAVLAEIDSRG